MRHHWHREGRIDARDEMGVEQVGDFRGSYDIDAIVTKNLDKLASGDIISYCEVTMAALKEKVGASEEENMRLRMDFYAYGEDAVAYRDSRRKCDRNTISLKRNLGEM